MDFSLLVELEFLLLIVGLILLVVSADALVNGAVRLGAHLRVPPVAVALTVVAAGTSLPELVVSVRAALAGRADIALGNVVGSNIINIGLILGLSALLRQLPVDRGSLRRDGPIMVLCAAALVPIGMDAAISRVEGLLLLLVFGGWMLLLGRAARAEPPSTEEPPAGLGWGGTLARLAFGAAGLAVGAELLVDAATAMAQSLGVSQRIIGLTVVALGTSLPELATSVTAAIRGRADVAVGNVVGSNIFNIVAILGVTAVIQPISVDPQLANGDVLWMAGLSVLLMGVMWSGQRLVRAEGGLLLSVAAIWLYTLL